MKRETDQEDIVTRRYRFEPETWKAETAGVLIIALLCWALNSLVQVFDPNRQI